MNKPKIALIVPTIREISIKRFLKLWQKELEVLAKKYTFRLYVVEDNEEATFDIDKKYPFGFQHSSWSDIRAQFGKDAWIISRRSDAIRSFGVLLAYHDGCDYFITLDDDCRPHYNEKNRYGYFIESHIKNLTSYEHTESVWINSIKDLKPRGYPYLDTTVTKRLTNVAVSHGLWVDVPDFDAKVSLSLSKKDQYFDHVQNLVIARNKLFPMSSMNLAWRREIAPLMYFLLMGEDEAGNKHDYDRFGDIWCGLFVKKIVDILDYAVVSGDPCIYHERASNAIENLHKEAAGIKHHEILWRDIYSMTLTANSIKNLYKELALKLPGYSTYWEKTAKAMLTWIDLF